MREKQAVLDFIHAINTKELPCIIELMAENFHFIDPYGDMQTKIEMEGEWQGYFDWFPDYRIEIAEILRRGNTFAVFGYASGTYNGTDNHWRVPSAWRVIAEKGQINLWQVFADSQRPYESMQ